jgi:ABC-type Mn2+/Zn2+ transport system ATPase subunit
MTLVSAQDLAIGYDGRPVLEGVTFTVEPGQRLGVLGPNGGGKSTLVRALLGELTPLAGRLELGARCSVVPQTERSRLDYPVAALDVAVMGAVSRLPWWRRPGRRERRRAHEALAAVGLEQQAGRAFGELSGGQRQRVLVARALVQDAGLILLDEPFTGVDAVSAGVLAELIDSLAAEGRGVLIATHDVDQARGFDRVLCLNRRQIAFGTPDVLTRPVLEATYGGAIVAVDDATDGQPARGILPAHHHDHGDGHG